MRVTIADACLVEVASLVRAAVPGPSPVQTVPEVIPDAEPDPDTSSMLQIAASKFGGARAAQIQGRKVSERSTAGKCTVRILPASGMLYVGGGWGHLREKVGAGSHVTDDGLAMREALRSLWSQGCTRDWISGLSGGGQACLKRSGSIVARFTLDRTTEFHLEAQTQKSGPIIYQLYAPTNEATWTWHTTKLNYWEAKVTAGVFPILVPGAPGTWEYRPMITVVLGKAKDALPEGLRKIIDWYYDTFGSVPVISAVTGLQNWITNKDPGDDLGYKLAVKMKKIKWE